MSQAEFGTLIGQLLNYSGQKNYALALELGYDVSYISKIINARILPVSKNAAIFCRKTSEFIVRESERTAKNAIAGYLNIEPGDYVETEEAKKLIDKIENELYQAYLRSSSKEPQTNSVITSENLSSEKSNSITVVNPRLRRKYLSVPFNGSYTKEQPLELIIMSNLFEMSREDKLHMAGIEKNEVERFNMEATHFRIILSLGTQDKMDLIFDPILLMYMVNNYSCSTFELYATNFHFHSMMVAVKHNFAHFGVFGPDKRMLVTNTTTDEAAINETYETLEDIIATNAHAVFQRFTPEEMIITKNYMKTIIGKNIRVLVGIVNELFMPSELFLKLAEENFGENPAILEEIRKIDIVLNNATYSSEIEVLLYEQTLNNYVLTGEVNFFNKKVKVSVEDRKSHITHLINLFKEHENMHIKIIKSYFIEEFKQFENPSCFLSNISNYVRLNTKMTDKTLALIKDNKLNQIFDRFFDEAWNNRPDVVSDTSVLPTIELSLNYIELLELGIDMKEMQA